MEAASCECSLLRQRGAIHVLKGPLTPEISNKIWFSRSDTIFSQVWNNQTSKKAESQSQMQKGSGYKGTIFPGGFSGSGWAFWASVVGCESPQLLQRKPPGKCLNRVMSLKTLTFKNYKNTVKWNPKVNTSPTLLSQTRHFLSLFSCFDHWCGRKHRNNGRRTSLGRAPLACVAGLPVTGILMFSFTPVTCGKHHKFQTRQRLSLGRKSVTWGAWCWKALEGLPLESRTVRN